MRGIWTLAKKDIKAVFNSPLFYVVAGLCAVVWTGAFIVAIRDFAQRSMFMMQQMRGEGGGLSMHIEVFARHISLTNFIMILAVAAITMRLFAEEKRQRTFDLLMTSPVNTTQIVLGKYLAGVVSAWALVGISLLYPVSMAYLTTFDWGSLASAYIGLLFLVAGYVAIGMFSSAMTENAVIAVVMSLIFSVGIWFVGMGADTAENPVMQKVFEHLSVGLHFWNFLKGGVSTASIVFFLSVVTLFGFFTHRVIEFSRWR